MRRGGPLADDSASPPPGVRMSPQPGRARGTVDRLYNEADVWPQPESEWAPLA